ncbi:hypothetical protein AB0G32_14690 [Streptomyces sp. NPDC023723]|uniref:hypothetical protein n=1 Tax=Streptomyces sp. NPDC023723 TaxID=3154323 RepID=UPI0033C327AF
MTHCLAPQHAGDAAHPCIRLMLGGDSPQGTFTSSWTWAAVIGLATFVVTTCVSIDQVRKSRRAKEAKRYQPDYDLLNETVVVLDKLAGTAAQKADLVRLNQLLSRVKQAERRFPALPFGAVVAHLDNYRKATLPDDFRRKLLGKKMPLDELLGLSRQQGAAIAGALAAIAQVLSEIDRRTA